MQSNSMNRPSETCSSSFSSQQLKENQTYFDGNAWNITIPNQLKAMFTYADYSADDIGYNMKFYHQYIKPFLGPEPSSPIAEWKSYINDDYSPIEITYSFKKTDKHPTVKCIFEPIEQYGNEGQLSNISAALKFAKELQLANSSNFNSDALALLLKPISVQDFHQANYHLCFGFDFRDCANSFPLIQAYVGSNSNRLPGAITMFSYVTTMMKSLKLERAWQCVLDYFQTLPNDSCRSDIDCVSIDCVDKTTSKMRVKVYVRYFQCTKDHLIEHLALNGLLSNENSDFKHVIKQWENFLPETHILCPANNNVTKSFLVYYEFDQTKPESPTLTKFYFPIRHYVQNDQILTNRISQYLDDIGFEKYGGINYINHIKSLCKHRALDKRSGYHRLIAGSLSKDNPEFKLYYSPELYAEERFHTNHTKLFNRDYT